MTISLKPCLCSPVGKDQNNGISGILQRLFQVPKLCGYCVTQAQSPEPCRGIPGMPGSNVHSPSQLGDSKGTRRGGMDLPSVLEENEQPSP